MYRPLHVFTTLTLLSLAIGVAMVFRDAALIPGLTLSDLALPAGLLAVELALILCAARDLRWAQYVYVFLFFFGVVFRLAAVSDLFGADPFAGMVMLIAFVLNAIGVGALFMELNAQRRAQNRRAETQLAEKSGTSASHAAI